jgi:hypothetical protein
MVKAPCFIFNYLRYLCWFNQWYFHHSTKCYYWLQKCFRNSFLIFGLHFLTIKFNFLFQIIIKDITSFTRINYFKGSPLRGIIIFKEIFRLSLLNYTNFVNLVNFIWNEIKTRFFLVSYQVDSTYYLLCLTTLFHASVTKWYDCENFKLNLSTWLNFCHSN